VKPYKCDILCLWYSTFPKETRQRFSEKLCMLKTAYSAFIKNWKGCLNHHLTPRKTSIVVMVTNMFRISLIEYNTTCKYASSTKFKNTKLAHVELNTKCAVVPTGNFNGCGHQHLHPTPSRLTCNIFHY
jgi:hypothetical protein